LEAEMPTIAVLGAAGVVGRAVAVDAAVRGHHVVPLVRDRDRARAVLDELRDSLADLPEVAGDLAAPRTTDASQLDTLAAAVADVDLLVAAVGPSAVLGAGVQETVVARGVHLVDLGASPGYLRWAYDQGSSAALEAGVTVVPGAGFSPLVGDLLAAVAANAVRAPAAAHIAYVLPGGVQLGDATPGVRASLAAGVGRPLLALVDGHLEEERTAEERRLAWFPRPVGPHHAAAIPGGEPLTVPRHVPGVRTVRTYLAMPSWRAELAQFQANASRWDAARRRVIGRIERDRPAPSAVRRAGLRWGVVAEVADGQAVARAWANGHDPYDLAAQAALQIAERVLAGETPAGVLAPAQVADPAQLLDGLSAVTDLRWSVVRPEDQLPARRA
jgi:short subunit dehydrogenase-like uncharacterized protein